MEKIIQFIKPCPFAITRIVDGQEVKVLFELAMYTTKKEYYASRMRKGKVVRDFVDIDSYGLFVIEVMERNGEITKGEPIDLGVKSAHPRHISSLIHQLCRVPISDVRYIKDLYEEEASSHVWCQGWPDALAQVASVQLGRNLSSTDLQPFTEDVRLKRNRLLGKLNPFRDLPKPYNQNGGLNT